MATKYPELFAALAADFPGVKWKPGAKGGKQQPYVTARQVMNRLDDVLGPENWEDAYEEHEHSVLCRLTVRLPDASTITKADAGGFAGMADEDSDAKSGYSDAFKRAAVKFGVARLLYGDGTPHFEAGPANGPVDPPTPPAHGKAHELWEWAKTVLACDRVEAAAKAMFGKRALDLTDDQADDVYGEASKTLPVGPSQSPHQPPPIPEAPKTLFPTEGETTKGQKLAAWCGRHGHTQRASALAWSNHKAKVEELTDSQADALYALLAAVKPVDLSAGRPAAQGSGATNENGNPVKFGWPKSGSALYAWAKNLEGAFNVSVIKAIDNQFGPGTAYDFPRTYKEWNAEMVEAAAVFAAKIVKGLDGYDGQFDDKVPDLTDLKAALVVALKRLVAHNGHKDPSQAILDATCRQHSAMLDADTAGGEVLDDLEACQSERLIRAVQKSVEKDLIDLEGAF